MLLLHAAWHKVLKVLHLTMITFLTYHNACDFVCGNMCFPRIADVAVSRTVRSGFSPAGTCVSYSKAHVPGALEPSLKTCETAWP